MHTQYNIQHFYIGIYLHCINDLTTNFNQNIQLWNFSDNKKVLFMYGKEIH